MMRRRDDPPPPGEGDHPKDGGGAPASREDARSVGKGKAEMSEKFRKIGSELYVGANGREHD
jgi:hypothetical protein